MPVVTDSFYGGLTSLTYWVIVAIWAVIVAVLIRRIGSARDIDGGFNVLIIVLAVDAIRTLIENVYFGALWTSNYGYLPESIGMTLGAPELLAVPKLINVAAGLLVLFLLLRRWLPDAERERFAMLLSAELGLQETAGLRDRYRKIIDTSPDVICALDADARFVEVGARVEGVLTYAPADLVGRAFIDFVEPDDRPLAARQLTAALQGARTSDTMLRHPTPGGTIKQLIWSFAVSEDRQELFGVGRDQSHLLSLETQLQQAQRLESVGRLTGGIAHDFNNLLTVMMGTTELLLEEFADDPEKRHLLEVNRAAADRAAALTNRLLAFASRQVLQPQAVDLNELIQGMETLIRRAISESVTLQLEYSRDLPAALIDPGQFESALLNLCINARDAMPSGGTLTVATGSYVLGPADANPVQDLHPGRYLRVSVTDTGVGIPPEHLPRVFDPFFTTKEVGKGTGLGLSMVYGFIRQSQGSIAIRSAVGRGTTLDLYLPIAGGAEGAAAANPEVSGTPRGTECILVVEDDDLVQAHVRSQLRMLGYRVIVAGDGQSALDALRQHADIDLLFTDVVMPGGMDGSQLAAAARELRPELRVLLTSGYTEGVLTDTIVGRSRAELLMKPYRLRDLAQMVRAALD